MLATLGVGCGEWLQRSRDDQGTFTEFRSFTLDVLYSIGFPEPITILLQMINLHSSGL